MPAGNFGHFPRRARGKPVEDANEDEEELLEWDLPTTRDTVLWLIDAGPKMHDRTITLSQKRGSGSGEHTAERQVSVFHQALQAAYQFQRSKLVNSPADHCGILLYNTEETNVQEAGKNVAYPNSVSIQKIGQVSIPPISELKDDLQNSLDNGPEYFRDKYRPASQQSRIHYALSNAEAMMFAAGKSGSKRIFFVTDEDDPMKDKKGKTEQQRLALEKVRSMIKRGIEFEPFLVSTEKHCFETVHFYGDLFSTYGDEEEDQANSQESSQPSNYNRRAWNATTKFDHLEQEIGARETPKRVIFSVPLKLSKDVTIGVKGYCTIVKATKGLPVRVVEMEREDEDDPAVYKEIVTQTTLVCADTGRPLDKESEIDRAFSFGNENSLRSQVRFSSSEMHKLRTFGQEPGIRVLGFKPTRELHFHENIKHSYFIYPSDSPYPNSTRAFSALLQSMAKKDKIALAVFAPRRNVVPTFAALLPQLEERGQDGQVEPPGIHVVCLPYADDIREAPERHRDQLKASEEQINLASKIINDYSKKSAFNPDFFPNAALDHHYQVLLAVAFNDEIPGSVDDKTLPDYGMIKKRVGALIEEWNEMISDDDRVLKMMSREILTSSRKRPADFSNEDEPELKKRYMTGNIGVLVADKLKSACDYYRLPKTGKKADLVDRLNEHLAKLVAKEEK